MLYYLLFWTLLGFIIHFYIIFGTNILIRGPSQNCCFFAYFRVSKKRNIKQSPNGMKPSGTWFSEQTWSRGLGVDIKQSTRRPRGRGARPPPWARPPPSWAPRGFPYRLLLPIYISIYPKNIREQNRSGVPPPQASVATKNQSGPCSGTLPEGGSLTGGHLHHPGALHDEEGVVHPRGWGYVPVAMCLISLSLVFLIWHDLDVSRALLL